MDAPNGHWDEEQVSKLRETVREHTEQFGEVHATIEEVRGEEITTRAAVAHLSTDVRLQSAEVARQGARVAELNSTVVALERSITELIAELRRDRA